nr:retrovirus-related Pol polyprotein from transposon TNT 1-94 [Tanacetum cinerariifolium]
SLGERSREAWCCSGFIDFNAADPKPQVTRPRPAKTVVTEPHSPPRRHINRSLSPKASTFPPKVIAAKAPMVNVVKGVQGKWEWKPKCLILDHGNPQHALKDKGVIDSRCSRNITGNMSYLSDFEKLNGGYVVFGRNPKGGKIFEKGKIRIRKLDFDDVYFVKELKFNLFSVSQISDNGTEFKNNDLNQFCGMKGIKRKFSLPRTPQQNGIAKRKNRTLIEAARTMLADLLLPIPFWAEVVNTACYVHNRVLVTKPQNKTPCELLHGRTPSIGFMRPFGCPMTILNTLDSVGKFDGKVDEGFLVGYSVSSKAFRVFNSRTRIVQETLHINFLENKPLVASSGPTWCQEQFDAEKAGEESVQQYVLFPVWSSGSTNPQNTDDAAFNVKEPEFKGRKPQYEVHISPSKFEDFSDDSINKVNAVDSLVPDVGQISTNNTNTFSDAGSSNASVSPTHGKSSYAADSPVLAVGQISTNSTNTFSAAGPSNASISPTHGKSSYAADSLVPAVGQISTNSTNTFSAADPSKVVVSSTHGKSLYVHSSQLLDDPNMPELEDITYSDDEDDVGADADFNNLETTIIVSPIPTTRVHRDHPVTQIIGDLSSATQTRKEPKRVHRALKDSSWIEAMQEELLQFKMQKVWVLVDFPHGKGAIGHTQEEGIDYEEVFALAARIEAIRLFLAYASFMGFMIYQIDVKSAFLYDTIEEEVYVYQPPGFEDHDFPDKVYKVVKALYGLHQAPRAWKFGLTDEKSASTPIDTEKPLLKDLDDEDVDVHTYGSMIGSLMYLTSSRPDIIYLKGKPHLGLWYLKDSPFNLVAYSDSDYAVASLDRKSTTEGCQFLGCRLISWQCKKQTVVATSSTEAEYVAAVVLSSMKALKRNLHVTNILSAD